jgi:ribonuclease P protein component
MEGTPTPQARLRFSRRQRLTLALEFQRAYAARTSVVRGPLRVHAVPNQLPMARLGLSVPRRVGTAVRRNRVKRLLREAFRLHQAQLPAGLDLVIGVQPHDEVALNVYAQALVGAAQALANTWRSRGKLTGEVAALKPSKFSKSPPTGPIGEAP